jgi:hypothetical protein
VLSESSRSGGKTRCLPTTECDEVAFGGWTLGWEPNVDTDQLIEAALKGFSPDDTYVTGQTRAGVGWVALVPIGHQEMIRSNIDTLSGR